MLMIRLSTRTTANSEASVIAVLEKKMEKDNAMNLTILRKLLLPVSLLAFGAASGYAAPVDCSTITTLAEAIATDFNPTPGCMEANILFSNFSFDFTSGTSNPNNPAPLTPAAAQVAFHINNDGLGDYTVLADFSNSIPLFAVAANTTMAFELEYVATEQLASTTITDIAGSANLGIRTNTPSPTGAFTKTECANAAYPDTGGAFPAPLGAGGNGCAASSTVQNSTWGAVQAFPGDPADLGNQSNQSLDLDTTGQNLTSAGIYDRVSLNGGSTDDPSGASQAAVGSIENDFAETTTLTGAPEPGTFLLLGGALVAFGAIRRRKTV